MARDRYAMPVALGLLTFAASFVGGVVALVGVRGNAASKRPDL
jgi:hypothetical protein